MQQEPQTWRQLLGSLNGEEKRKIIAELGIQGKTLERWKGRSPSSSASLSPF